MSKYQRVTDVYIIYEHLPTNHQFINRETVMCVLFQKITSTEKLRFLFRVFFWALKQLFLQHDVRIAKVITNQ